MKTFYEKLKVFAKHASAWVKIILICIGIILVLILLYYLKMPFKWVISLFRGGLKTSKDKIVPKREGTEIADEDTSTYPDPKKSENYKTKTEKAINKIDGVLEDWSK